MTFKNIKSLEKHLKNKINNALLNEVADTIKDTESEQVDKIVYSYPNKYYRRRGSHGGGLGDITNMTSEMVDDGVLAVKNRTPPNPYYSHDALNGEFIDYAVEYGVDYDFLNPGARPFIERTKDELRSNGELVNAMKKGLKRQGIDTE